MTLQARLEALIAAIRTKFNAIMPRLLPSGGTIGQILAKTSSNNYETGWIDATSSPGGASSWTNIVLDADFILPSTATFSNINDGVTTLTFTPPPNMVWEMTGKILIETATATNLPRVGVNIGGNAANGHGGVNIWGPAATATGAGVGAFGAWKNNTSQVNVQMAAGGLPAANVPYEVEISMSGRSGASPQPITVQLANETAAASMGKALRGSFIRWQTIA